MKFTIPYLITAAIATTVSADSLYVQETCFFGCVRTGTFTTSAGSYRVNADNGCRGTSVPGMTEFCMDWGRNRGHFRFSHQSHKRCLVLDSSEYYDCGEPICWNYWFREASCTWRTLEDGQTEDEDGADEIDRVSVTVFPTTLVPVNKASQEAKAGDSVVV